MSTFVPPTSANERTPCVLGPRHVEGSKISDG